MTSIGNKEIFAQNLSYYLQRCGKEQKEVAEIMGVATSTFNDWVKGKKYPRMDKVEMLANYFGILKSDLIEDKTEEQKTPPTITLTEEERILLEAFRKLPDLQKESLRNLILNYDNNRK